MSKPDGWSLTFFAANRRNSDCLGDFQMELLKAQLNLHVEAHFYSGRTNNGSYRSYIWITSQARLNIQLERFEKEFSHRAELLKC